MLLATGFVNRRGQFLPPPHRVHESTPLHRSQKYLLLVITSLTPTAAPNFVQIRPRGDSGQMGKIKRFFVYLYLFRELTYRSDSSTDFHVWWLKRRGLAQGCAFRGFRWYRSPFWGAKSSQNRIIETISLISTKFCTTTEINKWSSWVVPIVFKKSKMADGRCVENKPLNRHISATVWPILIKFG